MEPHTGIIDSNPSACLKMACLQIQATGPCATPFRVYFTLNLQARDPPIGPHKVELWVQVFLKIDATLDPQETEGTLWEYTTILFCYCMKNWIP